MTVDPQAIEILKETLSSAKHRDNVARVLAGGCDAILKEIEKTVLPRRLLFANDEQELSMVAGSGRMLRMISPGLDMDAPREEQLSQLAALIVAFARGDELRVSSEFLEEDVAAEEVGFSANEIATELDNTPKAPISDAVPVDETFAIGTQGYFEGLEALASGQAFLLANGEQIEITGEDILPAEDEDVGPLLAELARLKDAINELCGADALLLGAGEQHSIGFAFSEDGDVVSRFNGQPLDRVAQRWAKACLKGKV